jgi:general secretion pathway protein C
MKKFAVALMHLSMLALVCAIAAYWAIRILTPAPASVAPPPPAVALREVDPVLAARMFGLVQAAAPARLTLNVQALGAFSAGRDSAAVLVVDGKPARVYLLNQDVAGGARLVDVRRDAVTIEHDGARRDFALPPQPMLGLGGGRPPAGHTREGNTLTAPTVATAGQPAAAPQRPLAPRGAAPQPMAVPTPPAPAPQPMPMQPPLVQPQLLQPEQDDVAGENPAAPPRRAAPGRLQSQ